MTRKEWLAGIVVGSAVALLPSAARAQDKQPETPASALLERQEKAQKESIKKLAPEIQQVYQDMFRQARDQNTELYKKLEEYRLGKRAL